MSPLKKKWVQTSVVEELQEPQSLYSAEKKVCLACKLSPFLDGSQEDRKRGPSRVQGMVSSLFPWRHMLWQPQEKLLRF